MATTNWMFLLLGRICVLYIYMYVSVCSKQRVLALFYISQVFSVISIVDRIRLYVGIYTTSLRLAINANHSPFRFFYIFPCGIVIIVVVGFVNQHYLIFDLLFVFSADIHCQYFCYTSVLIFFRFSIVFCLFVHGSFWFRYVVLLYVVCKFIILNSILARPLLCFRVYIYILFIWIYGTLCSNRLLMILSDWPEAVLIWIPHDQQVGILGLRVVELGFNELSTVNNAGVSSKINQINNKAKRK